MKYTKHNLNILKELGFKRSYIDKNPRFDYYDLDNGWGFRLDAVKDFKHLAERLFEGRAENVRDNEGKYTYPCGWSIVAIPPEKRD